MKGFTLIEILIVMVILMTVVSVVTSIILLSNVVYSQKEKSTEVLQNGRVIMDVISREVRQARRIVTNLSEIREESASEIIFQDGHRDVVYVDEEARYYYIQYVQNIEGTLNRNEFLENENLSSFEGLIPEEEEVIGEYINNIDFWGSQPVNIFIEIEKNNKKIELFNMVFLRNI